MRVLNRKALTCLGLSVFALTASAEGVLERVTKGGPFVIAHREASIPFSYMNAGKPVGYAMDLCLRIAEVVRAKTGAKNMPVQFMVVPPANRVEVIKSGKADLECGSTTNNAERRKNVAFTIPHYITGARMLVPAASKIERIDELEKKKVVSTKGTTPLAALQQANRALNLQMNIMEAPDHDAAMAMIVKGEADAFVMDDVLLYGLVANSKNPQSVKVVGRFITSEPLAIMLRKDDADFKKLVDDEMRRLISSREIYALYDKWFNQAIPPTNRPLNLPISYLLKDFWKYPTSEVPN